ncbi:MAG: peptidyl-tRNA hydrolase Pth2 [Pyrobaculum sp.]|jgi:PTH2 family peptidyl-tRNA hydrolase
MKMAIVIRRDLKISCGKAAAQAGHAAVECVMLALEEDKWRRWLDRWLAEGQKKVILAAEGVAHLYELRNKAKELDLPTAVVVDAGLTEIPPDTPTAICVGPAPEELVDKVTGALKLYR